MTPEYTDWIEVKIGGLWEESSFEITFNQKVTSNMGDAHKRCKHCHSFHKETSGIPPYIHTEDVCICPRVVVAANEGGHNSTGVCLDCILEAAATLPTETPA